MKYLVILFLAILLFGCKTRDVTLNEKLNNRIITKSGDTLIITKVRVMRALELNETYRIVDKDGKVIRVIKKIN